MLSSVVAFIFITNTPDNHSLHTRPKTNSSPSDLTLTNGALNKLADDAQPCCAEITNSARAQTIFPPRFAGYRRTAELFAHQPFPPLSHFSNDVKCLLMTEEAKGFFQESIKHRV